MCAKWLPILSRPQNIKIHRYNDSLEKKITVQAYKLIINCSKPA